MKDTMPDVYNVKFDLKKFPSDEKLKKEVAFFRHPVHYVTSSMISLPLIKCRLCLFVHVSGIFQTTEPIEMKFTHNFRVVPVSVLSKFFFCFSIYFSDFFRKNTFKSLFFPFYSKTTEMIDLK